MFRRIIGVWLLAFAGAAHAGAPWLVATTDHFRVYSRLSEPALHLFATQLEQYDALLRRFSGLPADSGADERRLDVYMVKDQLAVARSQNTASDSIVGFYSPSAAGPLAVVPQIGENPYLDKRFALTPQIVLFHEYAHHFMLQHFPALYSSWYVEGFAEFYGNTEFLPDGKVAIGKVAGYRFPDLADNWGPPLAILIGADRKPGQPGGGSVFEFYARAWLLTHYLSLSPQRGGQLAAYLAARNRGLGEREAFRQGLHASIEEIDREVHAYFRAARLDYGEVTAPPPPADITIARVADGEAAALPQVPRLRVVQEDIADGHASSAESYDIAGDLRRVAHDHPDDPLVLELLGEAEQAYGRKDAAREAAQAALRLDPKNARAELLLGQLALANAIAGKGGTVDDARRLIVRANHMSPDDPLALIAYYRSFTDAKQTAPALAATGLQRAEILAPQDPRLRVLLAQREIADGKPQDAAELLRPVAFSPHPTPSSATAQKLLAGIPVAQDTPPPAAPSAAAAAH